MEIEAQTEYAVLTKMLTEIEFKLSVNRKVKSAVGYIIERLLEKQDQLQKRQEFLKKGKAANA